MSGSSELIEKGLIALLDLAGETAYESLPLSDIAAKAGNSL